MRTAAVFLLPILLQAQERGGFTIHMMLHAIGEEHYEITRSDDGESVTMHASLEYSDRGNKRTVSTKLSMKSDLSPQRFEVTGRPNGVTTVDGDQAKVREGETVRTVELAPPFFVGLGHMPFSVQMMMMRFWLAHGKPAHLPILRASPASEDVQISMVGRDSIVIDGKPVALTRYTVANIVFGREVLWMNADGQLAAAMTFAAGLPLEAVRTEYEPAFAELFRAGVDQQMRTRESMERQVAPEHTGSFAIAGATLVDATGRAPVPDSVVIVREGHIAAAGSRNQVPIPNGMATVNAKGKMLLPGLWEMHTHFSGVEFGPAYLAAGVTTARDCGGEFDFLVAERDAINEHHGMGPRLLLAGIVDASGPKGFGAVFADTPEEAREVVARYKTAGFEQIKLYTFLKPDVVAALAAEAHRVGMTVTGHVPAALNAFQGVEAGMDQINHLNYVSQMMRAPEGGRGAPVELDSDLARKAIQFFLEHRTVIDPTASWGEMGGHPSTVDIRSFEPAIVKAPFTVAAKFSQGSPTDAGQFRARMAETVATIGALHRAGVIIVPGSDTGLIGYGLDRELELYVEAGMKPIEAIQAATIVSARAMKHDRDSGTVEAGKRADLILVDGNPLQNISDIRRVSKVVANGRMYDCAKLWQVAGFRP
jgi:imidazolonepropionase-like amidohydrolase